MDAKKMSFKGFMWEILIIGIFALLPDLLIKLIYIVKCYFIIVNFNSNFVSSI